jgi:hypothetical protein
MTSPDDYEAKTTVGEGSDMITTTLLPPERKRLETKILLETEE